MNIFPVAGVILLLAAFIALPGCSTQEHPDQDIAEMEGFAQELAGSVSAGLSDINTGLENNSRTLSGTGLSGPAAEAVLANNLLSHSFAVSSLVISRDGVIMNAAPRHYSGTHRDQPESPAGGTGREYKAHSIVKRCIPDGRGIFRGFPELPSFFCIR